VNKKNSDNIKMMQGMYVKKGLQYYIPLGHDAYTEERSSTFLRNVANFLPVRTASHSRRMSCRRSAP